MARSVDLEDLVEHFTLVPAEPGLLRGKAGATRLGFGLMLKFLIWKGRFPNSVSELPDNAINHVARQVGVPAPEIAAYDWSGRQIKRHRVEIRRSVGYRECSVAEAEKLTDWLARHVACSERAPTGYEMSCWPAAGPSGSSRRRGPASSGSCARRCIRPRRRCSLRSCPAWAPMPWCAWRPS